MRQTARRISDLGRVVTGKTPPTQRTELFGGEYPFVTPTDLDFSHWYCRTTERTVTEEARAVLRNQFIPANAVMFTCIGATIGKCGIAASECLTNQQINSVIVNGEHDARFIYYRLCLMADEVKALGGGAATPIVSKSKFEDFQIMVPPLFHQQRIAQILSAYDELIENNRRRMALLEEAARQLYREWFVRLRFPGHEHTPLTNGLPHGWRNETLAAVCVPDGGIQTGPFGSQLHQAEYAEAGVPVVMPKDMISLRIDTATIARVPEDVAERLSRHRMQEGDVVYGRRGDIGRRAFIGRRQTGWICGTGNLRLRPDPRRISSRFFFDALGAPETFGVIASRAKGATLPNLNATVMETVPILLPPRALQNIYNDTIEPMAEQVEVLSEQNQKLRAARDLLLPRLMSGELAV